MRGAGIFAVLVLAGCLGVLGFFFGLMPVGSLLRSAAVSHAPATRTVIITADERGYRPMRDEDVRALPVTVDEKPAVAPAEPKRVTPRVADRPVDKPPVEKPAVEKPTTVAALPSPPAPPPAAAAPPAAPTPAASDDDAPLTTATTETDLELAAAKRAPRVAGFSILQIGDSHTAGDFFSGEVRRRLQAIYGDGGPGYIVAGLPRDVLNESVSITTSKGWSYEAIQRSQEIGAFWLSGFNAVAKKAGETLTFEAPHPVRYDVIDFEVVRQPGGGTIDIELDGRHEGTYELTADHTDPVVIRLLPKKGPTERVRRITITTKNDGEVRISSVGIYNTHAGITYSSVGFPGATVDLVNKFDKTLFANDLKRINPQIVVLAFGTNEGDKQKLDLAAYARDYEKVIGKIREALPSARFVIVGPPDGSELPAHCKEAERGKATCRVGKDDRPEECAWRRLPNLDAVRDTQREIAQRHGFAFWSWASIMPKECGPHRWVHATPALMTKDHVHFTKLGYKKSADAFLRTLVHLIQQQPLTRAASDN